MDVENKEKQHTVMLDIPEAVNGLVVCITESWQLLKTAPESVQATQKGANVILDSAQGKVELVFYLVSYNRSWTF